MNWELVGIPAEVVGAFAVVASLVYLGRRIALSKHLANELEGLFDLDGSIEAEV